MTTLRRCPECRQTVTSEDCIRCPECSAVLDADSSVVDRPELHDILEKVRHQIDGLDETAEEHSSGSGAAEDRDVTGILSGLDFQSLLVESLDDSDSSESPDFRTASQRSAKKSAPSVDAAPGASPDDGLSGSGAQPASSIGKAYGSFKETHAPPAQEADPAAETPVSRPVVPEPLPEQEDTDGVPSAVFVPSARNDEYAPVARKPKTWWGSARQMILLVLVLLVSIALFRIFGPERKKHTIDDFFQPGNPEVRFLDAVDFFEKHYERERAQQTGVGAARLEEPLLDRMEPGWPDEDSADSSTY